MITIGDKYKIVPDQYEWQLHTKRIGKDKNGNDKEVWYITHHPKNYTQVARAICDKEMKGSVANSLEDSVKCFEAAVEGLKGAIKEVAG